MTQVLMQYDTVSHSNQAADLSSFMVTLSKTFSMHVILEYRTGTSKLL